MKRIVVGTDLTPRSSGAVTMAADLAAATGATLHLVTAHKPSTGGVGAELAPMAPAAVVTRPSVDDRAALENDLRALGARVRRKQVPIEVHVCLGEAADVLCDVAETVDADVIVVGNKRMHGAGRLLGSVPNRVAHRAPCSVLIARTA